MNKRPHTAYEQALTALIHAHDHNMSKTEFYNLVVHELNAAWRRGYENCASEDGYTRREDMGR